MSKPTHVLLRLSLPLDWLSSVDDEQELLRAQALKQLRLAPAQMTGLTIHKKSLDARDKGRLKFVYTLHLTLTSPPRGKYEPPPAEQELAVPHLDAQEPRPLVLGAGPAGLFAALLLAEAGLRPLVIEQGQPVERRAADVSRFWQQGELNPCSNIQFGEGGAGAFSDGKLTSRSKDVLGREVLHRLIAAGASPGIAYWHKPHLGSDVLPLIIANIRQQIIAAGGEFAFGAELIGLNINRGQLRGVELLHNGQVQQLEADTLVLAGGNGARSLYQLLAEANIALQAKPFAVGLRIQQPQALIDANQYGSYAKHPLLGAADYALTFRDPASGRGCYTFCNCPGGQVVNASSEPGALVVNGASLAARSSAWANAAVVVGVAPGRDFADQPLAGMEFQRQLERAAFALGGGDYGLPIMSAAGFCGQSADIAARLDGAGSAACRVADLRGLFADELTQALVNALLHWNKQLPGFAENATLAAVESRTSAPLTIIRGADRQSINCRGLYPAGEGAGYAGGIVSSAIDGMHAALAIIEAAQ